jgi:hypothetical protein
MRYLRFPALKKAIFRVKGVSAIKNKLNNIAFASQGTFFS